MISFKISFITFTILSVAIWVMPVTSELTVEDLAGYCNTLLTTFSRFTDNKNDFLIYARAHEVDETKDLRFLQHLPLVDQNLFKKFTYRDFSKFRDFMLELRIDLGLTEVETGVDDNVLVLITRKYSAKLDEWFNDTTIIYPVTEFCRRSIQENVFFLHDLFREAVGMPTGITILPPSPSDSN